MANSTNTDFEMDTTMTATNIWQPTAQAAPWYEQTVFYIEIGIVVLIVVVVTAVMFAQRKRAKTLSLQVEKKVLFLLVDFICKISLRVFMDTF